MRFSILFKHLVIIVLFIAAGISSKSQVYEPKTTLASPEATSLGSYGNINVNLYTGQPGIEVPLFEANLASQFTLPVKLSYGANGFRPIEEASNVGLGWTLFCGSSIVRSVRGMDDLYNGAGIGYANLSITPDNYWYSYFVTRLTGSMMIL